MDFTEIKQQNVSVLGEGVFCQSKCNQDNVTWVDITGHFIHTILPHRSHDITQLYTPSITHVPTLDHPSLIIPIKSSPDHHLVAFKNSIVRWKTYTRTIDKIYATFNDPEVRFNDGKCDPLGRLWIGTTHLTNKPNSATLYRMDSEGLIDGNESNVGGGVKYMLTPVITGVSISNGIAWSLDGAFMYYIDTPKRAIAVYSYDLSSGQIINPTTPFCLFDLSHLAGVPDGMNIDSLGRLWVAFWDGSHISCIDPNNHQIFSIDLPVSRPTNVAISHHIPGRLYVTSAYNEVTQDGGYLMIVDTNEQFVNGASHEFREFD